MNTGNHTFAGAAPGAAAAGPAEEHPEGRAGQETPQPQPSTQAQACEGATALGASFEASYEVFWQRLLPVVSDSQQTPRLSTRASRHYAAAIARYWELSAGNGLADYESEVPRWVIDLAPGPGQFAWQVLMALREYTHSLYPVGYILCCKDEAHRQTFLSHPLWAIAIAEGQVSCFLHSDFLAGALPHRPLVVLDYAADGRLGHDLYAAHYGKLLSCKVSAQQNPTIDGGGQGRDAAPTFALHYDWSPADVSGLPQAWQALLGEYCQTLNSAALLLPTAAMRTVDVLTQHGEGSFLLLHTGCGAIDERAIRLGSFTPPLQVTVGDAPLPVNHHALAAYLYKAGAAIGGEIGAGGALTLNVAVRGEPDDKRVLVALMPLLEGAHDPAPLPGNDLPDEVDLLDCLVRLRAAQYDPSVLSALFPQLYAARWLLPTLMREQWRAALTRLWCQYQPEADGNPLYRMVAWLAWQVGDYGLARIAYLTGLELYGDNTIDLCELAVCLTETGQIAPALSVLQAVAPQSDELAAYERLRHDLEARWQSQQGAAWYNPALAEIDELRLVPLASHHAQALLYQFRDPQIATMTALPELTSLEDALRWIAAQAVDQRMCCAVMHQDHGFVGLVNLRVARDAGYFYFWMGVDHQGKGYGTKAGRALLCMAQARGITRLFTSAFADNLRSQLALANLGFARISAKALPPDDELIFFALGSADARADRERSAQLAALCKAIDSPFVFVETGSD